MLVSWIRWPFGKKAGETIIASPSARQTNSPKSTGVDDEYDPSTPFLDGYASSSLVGLDKPDKVTIAVEPPQKAASIMTETDTIQLGRLGRKRYSLIYINHDNNLLIRWSGMIAILCAIIIMGGVFLGWPRETTFTIESLDINPNNSTYYDDDKLMTNWLATVSIANYNFYPIKIEQMHALAYLEDDRRQPIGRGQGRNLYFPSRSRSLGQLEFQMPVYAPSTGLPSLIGECMKYDRVNLYFKAKVDMSWSHWSGYWIPWEIHATVECKMPSVSQL